MVYMVYILCMLYIICMVYILCMVYVLCMLYIVLCMVYKVSTILSVLSGTTGTSPHGASCRECCFLSGHYRR